MPRGGEAGRPETGMPRLCLGKPLEDDPNRRVALGPGERTVEMGGIHLTLMIGAVGLVVTVAEHEIPPQGRLRDERWSRTAKALAPHRSCAAARVRWRRFRPKSEERSVGKECVSTCRSRCAPNP